MENCFVVLELDVADQIIDNLHRQRKYVGKKLGSRLLCTPIDTQSHDDSIKTFCNFYLRNRQFFKAISKRSCWLQNFYVQVKGNLMTKVQIHRDSRMGRHILWLVDNVLENICGFYVAISIVD